MNNPTKTTRAVIYSRVSTDEQAEDNTSLDDQHDRCLDAIEQRKWEFVGEYREEGGSGSDQERRPQFRQMFKDASERKFDVVVIIATDRFYRDLILGYTALRDLWEKYGVQTVSLSEEIDMTSIDGQMMVQFRLVIAENERKKIVQRTSRGQRAAANMGRWPGGKPPFGYRLEGKAKTDVLPHAVPDEREREIIDTVWRLLVKKRMTCGEVAAYLNDTGRHPRGGMKGDGTQMRWEHATIRQLAQRTSLYDGLYHWGKPDGRRQSKKSHHTRLNPDGSLKFGATATLNMGNPPMSKTDWDAMQRALKRRNTTAPSAPQTQLLANRVFGDCGAYYNGVSLAEGKRAAYRCSRGRYKEKGGTRACDCPQFDSRWVDPIVWGEIIALLSNPARIQVAAREWLGLQAEDSPDEDVQRVQGLDTQISRHEQALDRLTHKWAFADDGGLIESKIAEVQRDLTALRERRIAIAALASDREARVQALTDLAQIADRMQGRLISMSLPDRRRVVELLDIRVQVTEWETRGRTRHPAAVSITGRLDPRLLSEGTPVGQPSGISVLPSGDHTPEHTEHGEGCYPSSSSSSPSRSCSPSSLGCSCSRSDSETKDTPCPRHTFLFAHSAQSARSVTMSVATCRAGCSSRS